MSTSVATSRTTRDVINELAGALLDYRRTVHQSWDMTDQLSTLQHQIDGLVNELRHMAPADTHWYNDYIARIESAACDAINNGTL